MLILIVSPSITSLKYWLSGPLRKNFSTSFFHLPLDSELFHHHRGTLLCYPFLVAHTSLPCPCPLATTNLFSTSVVYNFVFFHLCIHFTYYNCLTHKFWIDICWMNEWKHVKCSYLKLKTWNIGYFINEILIVWKLWSRLQNN